MSRIADDWRQQSASSSLEIRRPARGVVVLVVTGTDIGEHGERPFDELARDVAAGPFELFVDARESRAVALDVSGSWARWLSARRDALVRVNMLTGSRFVELTANFVRDFAELGERMRIYTDAVAFESALAAATVRGRPRGV
jgi:hypothetical protein